MKKHPAVSLASSGSLASLVMMIAFAACTRGGDAAKTSAIGEGATPARAARVVNLGIWSNYLTPEILAEFEKANGVRVQLSNYSSNEELVAKLQAGASGYDVVVPSDYMVSAMVKLKLLQPLRKEKLANAKDVDPRFLKKGYDPDNTYSLPYDWGTTGIAVNRSLYKGEIKGWKDLFERPDLAGKFSLLDDPRETIGAALRSLGYSMNSRKPEELEKAKALLIRNRPRVKSFTSETLAALTTGELPVAHAYVSDALQARRATGGKVEYVIPVEGATFWIDNLVIPANAPHPEEAHALINFLLAPKTSVSTVNRILVASANLGSVALLPENLRNDPSLFPGPAVMAKTEMIEDLGDAMNLWDRSWTEIKASTQ